MFNLEYKEDLPSSRYGSEYYNLRTNNKGVILSELKPRICNIQ